jgi:tyrosinase
MGGLSSTAESDACQKPTIVVREVWLSVFSKGGTPVNHNFTRRQFLLATGAAAASASLINSALSLFDHAEASQLAVRRDVGHMDVNDPVLVSYRKAVKAMKALPARDPRSWTYQAAIHGTLITPLKHAWNTHQHGNYFFWSWHRTYLYWFERIVRRFAHDPQWALPYWNWSQANERQLPASFRDPRSELFVSNRRATMNAGGALPPSHVEYAQAFSFSSFANASTSLEGSPHGTVHVDVGGWMGSALTAAQDPLFYLHHANIDRLWSLWLAQGGNRMDPIGDADWARHRFTFYNENGKPVQMTTCDVLRTAEELQYIYEGEPVQVKQYCPRKPVEPPISFVDERLIVAPISPVTLTAQATIVSIDMKDLSSKMQPVLDSTTDQIALELLDAEAESAPGVVWDVFVGAPKDTTPDSQSPSFVGSVALFGAGIRHVATHEFRPARFLFPMKRALAAVLQENKGQLPIRFVPQGVLVEGKPLAPDLKSPVRIGRIGIIVERTQQSGSSPQQ